MKNFTVKINLALMNGVKLVTSKKDNEKYVCIPLSDNYIFEGKKGLYLDLTAYSYDGKFGESHFLKNRIPKDMYEKMSEEDKKNTQIIGSLSPLEMDNGITEKADFQDFNEVSDEDSPFGD